MRTAVAALVTVSFLAVSYAAYAESVVPVQGRIPYFNSNLEGGPAVMRIDGGEGGGGGGGFVDPERPRNTLTPSKPANPAVQKKLTEDPNTYVTPSTAQPPATVGAEAVPITSQPATATVTDTGSTSGSSSSAASSADTGSVPLVISTDDGTADGSTITATTEGSGEVTTTTATITTEGGNTNVSASTLGNLERPAPAESSIFRSAQSIGEGIAVGAATLAATGLLSQLIKPSTPDMSTAPAMSPAAATAGANAQANSQANRTPQTLEGQRDIASGACNPEDLGRLNADAEARTALNLQRQQDILLQVSNMPSVDVLACTSRTGANIAAAVDALFHSSGFAQRFFDVSVMRNIQISVGSSPVAQAFMAPINAVLSTTMNAVVNTLQATVSKAISGLINKAVGGIGKNLAGDLNNLFAGSGLKFVQAASDNCRDQRLAYERARACISRLMKNGYTATSAQQCLDRAGIQATALAGGSVVNAPVPTSSSAGGVSRNEQGQVTSEYNRDTGWVQNYDANSGVPTGVTSVGPGI